MRNVASKLMINTLESKSITKMPPGLKKLKQVKMPKPKTVEEYVQKVKNKKS